MRVEAAVGVYAGVEEQANIVRTGDNAIDGAPRQRVSFSSPAGSQKGASLFADGDVGVHAATIDSDHRLGRKGKEKPMRVATWRQISLSSSI